MQPELSIVILAYRAEEAIISFVSQVSSQLDANSISNYELVLVANFDENDREDKTPEIAHSLAQTNHRIRVLAEPKKGRMGWDARKGLAACRGQTVALIDGDGQMPPEDIVRAHKVMTSGEFDFVKTYRIIREDGAFRVLSSKGFNIIFRLLFPSCRFRDINSKPKFISRQALLNMDLTCDGWFLDGELILEAMRLDLPFAEIPTTFKKNEWRGSFVKLSTVAEMLFSMILYRLGLNKRKNNGSPGSA